MRFPNSSYLHENEKEDTGQGHARFVAEICTSDLPSMHPNARYFVTRLLIQAQNFGVLFLKILNPVIQSNNLRTGTWNGYEICSLYVSGT